MSESPQLFEAKFNNLLAKLPDDLTDESAQNAMKAFETFSKTRPPEPEPEILPDPVPTTRLGKIRAGLSTALDNETTRTVIKAAGAFAGVAYVTHATIKKDHILERQALAQANANQPR